MKIQFIKDSMFHLEDYIASPDECELWTDEEVNEEYEWYEYLWTK